MNPDIEKVRELVRISPFTKGELAAMLNVSRMHLDRMTKRDNPPKPNAKTAYRIQGVHRLITYQLEHDLMQQCANGGAAFRQQIVNSVDKLIAVLRAYDEQHRDQAT